MEDIKEYKGKSTLIDRMSIPQSGIKIKGKGTINDSSDKK